MGRHGVEAAERREAQRFGVAIEVRQEKANWEEKIRNTYNYMEAHEIARKAIEGESRKLLETLTEGMAQEILKHPLAKSVKVTIRKLDLFAQGESGVTIERTS